MGITQLFRQAAKEYQTDTIQSFNTLRSALAQSRKTGDELLQAMAHNQLAHMYWKEGMYQRSDAHFESAKALYKAANRMLPYLITLRNIGRLRYEQGDYKNALEYYFTALDTYEEMEVKDVNLAWIYRYIGSVYKRQENFSLSRDYYIRALLLFEEFEHVEGCSSALNNLGIVYGELGDSEKELECFERALDLSLASNDKARSAVLLGNISDHYNMEGDYHKALEYALRGVGYSERQHDLSNLASDYLQLARIYISLKQFAPALQKLEEAEAMAKKANKKQALRLRNIYEQRAKLHELTEEFEKAQFYYEQYNFYKDSLVKHFGSERALPTAIQNKLDKHSNMTSKKENNKIEVSHTALAIVVLALLFLIVGILRKNNQEFEA